LAVSSKKSKNRVGRRVGASGLADPVLRRARAEQLVKWTLTGVPQTDMAAAYNITDRQVRKELARAKSDGTADAVVAQMRETMTKVPGVYDYILSAPAADLTDRDLRRAHELKLKAAESLSRAVGPHRPPSTATVTRRQSVDLDEFFKLRAARVGALPEPEPEVVDAEPAPVDD